MFASSLKFKTFISKFGHIKVSKYMVGGALMKVRESLS